MKSDFYIISTLIKYIIIFNCIFYLSDGQAKEEIIYDEQTSATGLISSINIISFNNYVSVNVVHKYIYAYDK